jgi:hypothetical protein
MSQSSAIRASARHATRPVAARPVPASPRLRVVAAPAHTRSRAGAVVGCAVLLVAGLVTLLLLQMSLERGTYALRTAQREARVLREQQQSLDEQLERLQAPQNLASRASALGMVQAPNPAFLRASDGKVLGVPAPGVAKPSPTVNKPRPSATIAAAGATKGAAKPMKKAEPTAKSPATAATNPPGRTTAPKPTP